MHDGQLIVHYDRSFQDLESAKVYLLFKFTSSFRLLPPCICHRSCIWQSCQMVDARYTLKNKLGRQFNSLTQLESISESN